MKSLQDMNVQNSYPLESGRPVGHTRMARGESTTNFRESRVAAEGKGVTPSKDPGVAIGMMNFQPVTKGTERNRTRENMNMEMNVAGESKSKEAFAKLKIKTLLGFLETL